MSKLKIAGATLALVFAASGSAFAQTADEIAAEKAKTPSTEGIVTSAASCQYEGGFLGKSEGADVCLVPIRGKDFATQAYDGQNLGVMACSGNGPFTNELTGSGSYCRIFLEAKPRKKTREELEQELKALTDAELEASNAELSATN